MRHLVESIVICSVMLMTQQIDFLKKFLLHRSIWIKPLFYLGSGWLLYILFRSEYLVINSWALTSQFGSILKKIRTQSFQILEIVPKWIIYSLPDALWLMSFGLTLQLIWKNDTKRIRMIWTVIPCTIAVLWELFQLKHYVNGTFDLVDLLFYFLTTLLLIINLKKNEKIV